MESGGNVQRSVLRVGGWAGVLAGVIVFVALITLILTLPLPAFPPDFEQNLVDFRANPTPLTVGLDLFILAGLVFLAFFAALYWSLREPSRVFARIGLGSGVLAVILIIVGIAGNLVSLNFFSALHADPAADRPVVVATFVAVQSLIQAGTTGGFFLLGLAFVGFGLAMRASPGYQEGFVWLTAVLGLLIVLLTFFILGLVSIILLAVLGLVLGWKVYSLSRAA